MLLSLEVAAWEEETKETSKHIRQEGRGNLINRAQQEASVPLMLRSLRKSNSWPSPMSLQIDPLPHASRIC